VSRIDMIDPITTTALTRHTWALMPFCWSVTDIPLLRVRSIPSIGNRFGS
jgi:hypothetical protein